MKSTRSFIRVSLVGVLTFGLLACTDLLLSDADSGDSTVGVPIVFSRFNDDVEITSEGEYVVIRTTGIPDHKSPYFDTDDSRYEPYDGDNPSFHLNMNRIVEQDFVFRIPKNPYEAGRKEATPLGAIGVALNGVAIFNQYAGAGRPLSYEKDSFDQYNGHPQEGGVYHYHVEPLYLTETLGDSSLIGFLLDGFPVYGPAENGSDVQNSDLDVYHGHFGSTSDYPDGIYHYHITSQDPYINGSGFFGVSGTVGR